MRRQLAGLENRNSAAAETRIIVQTSDSWSARLSYWAQVATLGVVIFGYFYTVRPAFQNQLLQEQAAQLTLENQAATDKLKATQTLQTAAESDLASLRAEQKALEGSLTQARVAETNLRSELTRAQYKALEATSGTTKALADLKSTKSTIEQEQRRTLMLYIAALVFASRADEELADVQSYLTAQSNLFKKDADGAFILKFKEKWPNAYEDLRRTLESSKAQDGSATPWVSKDIADEYEHRLEEQKQDFICEVPDSEAMRNRFLADEAALDGKVDKQLEEEAARLKAAERNPIARMAFRLDPQWIAQFKAVKRQDGVSQLASDLRGDVVGLHRRCRAKELGFFSLFKDVRK